MTQVALYVHTVDKVYDYMLVEGDIEDAVEELCQRHPDAEVVFEVWCEVTIIEPPKLRRI
jgi:hypothetical protein